MGPYTTAVIAITAVAVTFALIWHLIGYPLCMGLVNRWATDGPDRSVSRPSVSIIIPSYNEVDVIADRVRNLEALNYPSEQYEVIFVDSGSTDGTIKALRETVRPDTPPSVSIVLEEERAGKASAINLGLNRATGDIVLVSDANAMFDPDVLRRVVPHFDDPTVGAVAGRKKLPEEGNSITKSYRFYRDLEQMKAMGESVLDSTCQFLGELSAWRRGIAKADPECLSEDLDLSVQIRKKGYKIAYERRAIVYEHEPSDVSEQVTTNKRRTIGVLQTLVKHWRFFSTPIDTYRALIFPSRKTLMVFSPFLIFASAVLYAMLLLMRPYVGAVALTVPLLVGAASVIGLREMQSSLVEADEETGLTVSSIVGAAGYLMLMEYTILLAWRDFLSKEYSVLWEKSKSDRPSTDRSSKDS